MAPSPTDKTITKTRARRSSAGKPKGTLHYKKSSIVTRSTSASFSMMGEVNYYEDADDDNDHVSTSGCSTPKAQRFRIPEIETCPPAPKKQRVVPNCSLQRTPIAFYAAPDLELFFFFALRDISV
ncbi:hypothetical protein CFOL_v3_00467 [Cephalotus follicularis]|uniref:Uncharacterized protein n=1 Tax=Cephalotus follicularis TaxID=3775 RepID=A0A1Q3AMH3_CEPFO|nr:hypothetical protein CFOL_v3_00467 [Cephalotus follicularis]